MAPVDDLECVSLIEKDEEALVSSSSPARQRPCVWRCTLLGMVTLGLLSATFLMQSQPAGRPLEKADTSKGTSLFFKGPLGTALSVVLSGSHAMQAVGAVGTSMVEIDNVYKELNNSALHDLLFENETERLAALQGEELLGENNLKDGNACPDTEEAFGGLCYQKCADLSHGAYPIRTTAFSCCKQEPCNAFNSIFSSPVKLCHGLDVGGREPGIGCPHSFGDCLVNEEFHLGECYKKCMVLTSGKYPYRTTADTCCRWNMYAECVDPVNLLTDAAFSVGGGGGDAVLEKVASQVHPPLAELAEAPEAGTPAA